jgi:hypothetical protein
MWLRGKNNKAPRCASMEAETRKESPTMSAAETKKEGLCEVSRVRNAGGGTNCLTSDQEAGLGRGVFDLARFRRSLALCRSNRPLYSRVCVAWRPRSSMSNRNSLLYLARRPRSVVASGTWGAVVRATAAWVGLALSWRPG